MKGVAPFSDALEELTFFDGEEATFFEGEGSGVLPADLSTL